MEQLVKLADRARLTEADVLGLAREASGNPALRKIEELNENQLWALTRFLEIMAAPLRVPAAVLPFKQAA